MHIIQNFLINISICFGFKGFRLPFLSFLPAYDDRSDQRYAVRSVVCTMQVRPGAWGASILSTPIHLAGCVLVFVFAYLGRFWPVIIAGNNPRGFWV